MQKVIAFAVLIGCGGGERTPDASTPDATIFDGNDELVFSDAGNDTSAVYHLYDGGRACIPADANARAEYTCCADGGLCNGLCLEDDRGNVHCDCFGLKGGCAQDLVCCTVTFNCVSSASCVFGK
jgi:hypothetical protein